MFQPSDAAFDGSGRLGEVGVMLVLVLVCISKLYANLFKRFGEKK